MLSPVINSSSAREKPRRNGSRIDAGGGEYTEHDLRLTEGCAPVREDQIPGQNQFHCASQAGTGNGGDDRDVESGDMQDKAVELAQHRRRVFPLMLLDTRSEREVSSAAGEHDDLDVVLGTDHQECRLQFTHHLAGQHIPFATVQLDMRHGSAMREFQRYRLQLIYRMCFHLHACSSCLREAAL
jgi:hypothetical protein